MRYDLSYIRRHLARAVGDVQENLEVPAGIIRSWKMRGTSDCAEAILVNTRLSGGNTVELRFRDQRDYQRWERAIRRVERVVQRYKGRIDVDRKPLTEFLDDFSVGRVNVNYAPFYMMVALPAQNTLRSLRDAVG